MTEKCQNLGETRGDYMGNYYDPILLRPCRGVRFDGLESEIQEKLKDLF